MAIGVFSDTYSVQHVRFMLSACQKLEMLAINVPTTDFMTLGMSRQLGKDRSAQDYTATRPETTMVSRHATSN